jgi:hypothetical protein
MEFARLSRTAANPDKMFSKRTPGGKLVFYCIDDKEEALHHAVENVLSTHAIQSPRMLVV